MTRLECDRVDEALLAPLSELTASCLFEEECEAAFKRRVLTAATREDLDATYFGPGRRQQSTIGRSMLVCAEEDGRVVGACGVQVLILAPDGRGESELQTRADWQDARERPLLANLVVASDRRRRGLGRSLMRECEAVAREWSFDEMMLKVEVGNGDAIRLYRDCGYADVGLLEAEKPRAFDFGLELVRWEPTTLLCMRRELPPLASPPDAPPDLDAPAEPDAPPELDAPPEPSDAPLQSAGRQRRGQGFGWWLGSLMGTGGRDA